LDDEQALFDEMKKASPDQQYPPYCRYSSQTMVIHKKIKQSVNKLIRV
jgi:hypothetical protein